MPKLALALLLALPALAQALPITVVSATFVETGSNVACLHCEDTDDTNDFKAVLEFQSFEAMPGWQNWLGLIDFTGTTAQTFDGIDLHILIEVDADGALGTLQGSLFNASPTELVESCCFGEAGPVAFWQGGGPYPFTLPNNGEMRTWAVIEVTAEEVQAIPEPTTLLLLGAGLALGRRFSPSVPRGRSGADSPSH